MTDLFSYGTFTSHSGLQLPFKIDCDAFTDSDWESLAKIVRHKFSYSDVIGIPRGGLKFAEALRPYIRPGYPTLIVDDVLTTGKSLAEWRKPVPEPVIGVVVWARGYVPNWVLAMVIVQEWTQCEFTSN